MKKSDKLTVKQRISKIADMLIEGESRAIIIHYSSESWEIGERQTDKYIARARELIIHDIKRNVEYDYAKAVKRYEYLYQKALKSKNYKLATSINKELSNLQGLTKINVEHTGKVEFISNIPD